MSRASVWAAVAAMVLVAWADRICQAREPGSEAEVFSDAATVEERIESACALSVRAVRWLLPHGGEQRGELGGFVVDHVVDTMCGRRTIEQASDGLRDIDVVSDRHALGRREAAHHRDRFLDVRIAIAVHERQPKHADVETFEREEEAFGVELAHRVRRGRCARVVLAGEAATIRAVDQAGAREDEALHGGGTGGTREPLRAEIIDRLRLLGRRAAKERRAVDHDIDAAQRGGERIRVEQIAFGELDTSLTQGVGACLIAHEGAHLIAALGESFTESASDLTGRSSDEDFHVSNVGTGALFRLEKTDMRAPKLARPSGAGQNCAMHASATHHKGPMPSASTASAVAALFVSDCERDGPGLAIPRPEIQLVVRFGPSARSGLDAHAFGARQRVHRKLIRTGRAVTARLQLGAPDAVLGVPASALAGRIVALEDLWGDTATRRLFARLADAHDASDAAAILESAIAERLATAVGCDARAQLALAAADKLTNSNVNAVAVELGVSERHLRRVFRETVGVSPKAFAKLTRFHRALRAAREDAHASWATIAAAAGYYDQAHLIAEFRAIADVTPRALLCELRAATSVG